MVDFSLFYSGLWASAGNMLHLKPMSKTSGRKSIFLVVVVVLVAQLCWTLWNPMDYSLPGSSVHEILQVRILERIAIL